METSQAVPYKYNVGRRVIVIGPDSDDSPTRIGQTGRILYHTDYTANGPQSECVSFERIQAGGQPKHRAGFYPPESLREA